MPSGVRLLHNSRLLGWLGLTLHGETVVRKRGAYGTGQRLDAEPELLFRLREVDAGELFANLDATFEKRKFPSYPRVARKQRKAYAALAAPLPPGMTPVVAPVVAPI